jgi:hypothetical protein
MDASDIVSGLPAGNFDKPQSQDKINTEISQAIDKIQKDQDESALHFLEKLIERVDGCDLRGAPDGNGGSFKEDWIVVCTDQLPVYEQLIDAQDALTP